MASFSVSNNQLRQRIDNPANFSASESSFALQKHMEVEKLDKLNENVKILYLFIHYIHFTVIVNPYMKSLYEELFKTHKTKSTLYLQLKRIADKMIKIEPFKLFMKNIFQEANEKRVSDEPYPVIAVFIKYYHEKNMLFKRIKNIGLLDNIINKVKQESYLWLTEEGRSTYPSYTPEVHELYNSTQDQRYAPPPPPGPPPPPKSGKRNRRRTRVTRRRRNVGKKSRKRAT